MKRVDDEVLPKISDYQNYFTEFYDETSFKYNPNNDFLNKIVREWVKAKNKHFQFIMNTLYESLQLIYENYILFIMFSIGR